MFKMKRIGSDNQITVNKTYPDYLTQPLVNNFPGDPYLYDYVDEDPEFVNAVLTMESIQSNYNTVAEWEDACALYDRTIPIIYDHYGGEEETLALIKSMEDDDLGLRGWKRRPRLKKKAKKLIKSGISPSRVMISPSNLDFTKMNSLYPDDGETIEIKEKKPKGRLRQMLQREAYEEAGDVAVAKLYTKTGEEIQDVIANYYSGTRQVKYDSIESQLDPFTESIRSVINDHTEDGFIPDPDHSDCRSRYELDSSGMGVFDVGVKNRLSVYKEVFDDMGVNTLNRKNYSKQDLRLYDEMLGQTHLSKKELKKQRKAIKTYEQSREKRRNSQRELSKMLAKSKEINLTDNARISFSDYTVKRR